MGPSVRGIGGKNRCEVLTNVGSGEEYCAAEIVGLGKSFDEE